MEYNQDKWFDQVFSDAGLAPEELEATKKLLANDKVASNLRDTVLSRSDYSKNMDSMRDAETRIKTDNAQQTEDYLRMVAADHNNQDAWVKLQEERDNYQTLAGQSQDPYDYDTPAAPAVAGMSKNEAQVLVNQAISKSQEDTVSVMNEAISIYDAHNREFGEGFNLHEVVNHAMRNKLPIRKAYEDMTQDRRTEIYEQKHAKDLESAKKEGYEQAISQHNIPVSTSPRGIHSLRPPSTLPTKKADRISAAVDAWRTRDTAGA
jgi:hypothetical protein